MVSLVPIGNIRGPEGPEGPEGKRGLPGVNALPATQAVADYIRAEDSDVHAALKENFVTAVSTEHGTALYMNGVAL